MARSKTVVSSGLSLGGAFALILSWEAWHSFGWAVLHGIFGWFYVGYYFLIKNYDEILTLTGG